MTTYIKTSLQVAGVHRWETCPEGHECSFLKNDHRHIFFIECLKQVNHDDRDIEFIALKHKITKFLLDNWGAGAYCDFGSMSCEAIAKRVLDAFQLDECGVFEDNENGAIARR